jgi:hypothetical protein
LFLSVQGEKICSLKHCGVTSPATCRGRFWRFPG